MPGALKFTNFTIFHSHKLINSFSSPIPSAAVTAAVDSGKILRRNYFAGWWCRTTPCANPALGGTTPKLFLTRRNHYRNLGFYTSDSRNKGQDSHFHRTKKNNFGTQMGAGVNCKVETESDVSPPHKTPPPDSSRLLTLPTILTIGRVAAVPLLVSTFYVESWWGPPATVGIFIVAAATDWLDGYLARKMNLGTQFGAFLDPVADKLMVAATLILLCTKPFQAGMFGQAPWLLTVPAIAIISREITMSAVREWAASRNRKLLEAVAVNNLGKWKTATQMCALTALLAARDGRGRNSCFFWGSVALLFSMAFVVVIGCVYEKDMESAAAIVVFFGSYHLYNRDWSHLLLYGKLVLPLYGSSAEILHLRLGSNT